MKCSVFPPQADSVFSKKNCKLQIANCNFLLPAIYFYVFFCIILISLLGCGTSKYGYTYHPYENVMTIVSELAKNYPYDVYHLGYPKDITGQNIYKASIVRLENFEDLNPGLFTDVILSAMAGAYLKLGAYDDAIKLYKEVSQINESELKSDATKYIELLKKFKNTARRPEVTDNLDLFILKMEERINLTKKLIEEFKNTEFEPLARLEHEQAMVEYALLLKSIKTIIPDGIEKTIMALEVLIEENTASIKYYNHKLKLADFYFEIAKEYTALNPPETLRFDRNEWEGVIEKALLLYFDIMHADGFEEKIEARNKFNAINSYAAKIRKQAL